MSAPTMNAATMGAPTIEAARKGARRLAAAGVAALALAACTALAPQPPSLYTLTPKTTVAPELPRADWQLLVETPNAPAGLDTPRVAIIRNQSALDYFADVSWTDRAPSMVQSLIVESFEESGRIVSVGRENIGLRSDLVLKTDLRDFQAEYVTAGSSYPERVHVRIVAKLVAMPRRTIEAGETFDATAPIEGRGFPAIVAAFDEALGSAMKRLVTWTLTTGNAVRRAQGAQG